MPFTLEIVTPERLAWKGEASAPLQGADIAVVITKHDSVDAKKILSSAHYVFDTTGKVAGSKGL